MYRDEPLDDEAELRELAGDDAVDALLACDDELPQDPVLVALDALRILQGWVDDARAGTWFTTPQRRLEGHTPIEALSVGAFDDVLDVARAWAAAQG